MAVAKDRYYADMADRVESRDHDVKVAYGDRIVASEGAFGRAWLKFNPGKELVYVDDMEGRPRAITPKQKDVLYLAVSMIEGEFLTMRQMAERLGVSPSTVSRALTKLAAWGILAYVVGRGRYAGLVIFRRFRGDGRDRFREAAKARVRRWRERAAERLSRLEFNVATYILGKNGSGAGYRYVSVNGMDATLKSFPDWSSAEIEEALS
jgi:DNA-binding IclR family transcriptional regulator